MKSVSSSLSTVRCIAYAYLLGCLQALLTPICSKMFSLVVYSSAQLFPSAVNTIQNTHTSNPVRSAAILKLLEATKPAAFQHPLLFMEKKLLSGCFPHLLLYIQYLTEAIHQEQIMVLPSKLTLYL